MNELERVLVALGNDLEIPAAPDLAPRVAALVRPRRRIRPMRRVLAVALAVALAALAATLAIPEARSALLRVLHIGGARIELVDELPRVTAQPDLEFALGSRVTLDEARQRSGFDLRELDEDPDRVYLGERGTVWLLFGDPEQVRLLVAQTPRHSVDEPLLLKKLAAAGTSIEAVTVDGVPGVYLSGEPHYLFLLDEHGDVAEDSARLVRNVLLWDAEGVAFRLEGDFTRDEALELAGSLR